MEKATSTEDFHCIYTPTHRHITYIHLFNMQTHIQDFRKTLISSSGLKEGNCDSKMPNTLTLGRLIYQVQLIILEMTLPTMKHLVTQTDPFWRQSVFELKENNHKPQLLQTLKKKIIKKSSWIHFADLFRHSHWKEKHSFDNRITLSSVPKEHLIYTAVSTSNYTFHSHAEWYSKGHCGDLLLGDVLTSRFQIFRLPHAKIFSALLFSLHPFLFSLMHLLSIDLT